MNWYFFAKMESPNPKKEDQQNGIIQCDDIANITGVLGSVVVEYWRMFQKTVIFYDVILKHLLIFYWNIRQNFQYFNFNIWR